MQPATTLRFLGATDTVTGSRYLIETPTTRVAVDRYAASGEWEGRAGGYAIQGLGGRLVERIEGDYLNVVGLPGSLLLDVLEQEAPFLLRSGGFPSPKLHSGGS